MPCHPEGPSLLVMARRVLVHSNPFVPGWLLVGGLDQLVTDTRRRPRSAAAPLTAIQSHGASQACAESTHACDPEGARPPPALLLVIAAAYNWMVTALTSV